MILRAILAAVSLLAFCSSAHAECVTCPRARQVQIHDRDLRERVVTALLDAYDLLESAQCREAFGPQFRLTQERLTELTFVDGRKSWTCREDGSGARVYAQVHIGTTRVLVCPAFKRHTDPVAAVLHEAFHSVGVVDEPGMGGSRAITARVMERCK